MSRGLQIAGDLTLPLDAVTQAVAILAKRGAGKTYTAGVWAEEMLDAAVQVVILDPMGAWWGLRSSADGKGPGFPIAVLGGDHADVPLEATGGQVVADLAVDERLSMILDQSRFSKSERRRFVTDFLERLYLRNRESMHVILEEADLYAPQRYGAGEERMLGAVFDLVRRGRGRGLGATLITQRSATLNNEVLEQADILVTLRTVGPADRKAIDRWIDVHDDLARVKEVRDSLPSLPTGTAWVWWPEREILQRAAIRAKRTYDSSATPTPGQARVAPKTVADVDLTALTARMAATIEKAKADDPRELRKRIRELEQLTATLPPSEVEIVERVVEVPVLNGQVGDLREAIGQMAEIATGLTQVATGLGLHAATILTAIDRVATAPRSAQQVAPGPRRGSAGRTGAPREVESRPSVRTEGGRSGPGGDSRTVGAPPDAGPLTKGERAFLGILASFPEGRTKAQLAIMAGYKVTASITRNTLSSLRTKRLIEGSGDGLRATAAGYDAIGDAPAILTGSRLAAWWLEQLSKAERSFLEQLLAAYPAERTKAELAIGGDYDPAASVVRNSLSRLRTFGLISGRASFRASDELVG